MAKDNNFKLSDQVMLISGSPRMTVVEEPMRGVNILCGWFTREGEYRKEFFGPGAIRKVRIGDVKRHRVQGIGW